MKKNFPDEAKNIMNQRFNHDSLISVATVKDGMPHVRTVDGYYADGCFYVITYALSGKMQQIKDEPNVAVCGEWFTAHGKAENLGYICDEKNKSIADTLREAFKAWYGNGHIDESDINTCILKIALTDSVLFSNGMRYDIVF